MKVKNVIVFLFLFVISAQYGQQALTADMILKKVSDSYTARKNLSFNTKYSLYEDYSSKKAIEQYSGAFIRKEGVNYYKMKETEFVSFQNYSLKISNEEKIMVIEESNNSNQFESPITISNYLKHYNAKLLSSKGNYYVCELTPKAKVSQLALGKIQVLINKTDFTINKQILYLVESMESLDNNKKVKQTLPRLEIGFIPRKGSEKTDSQLVKLSYYFNKKGDKIVSAKKYQGYEIIKL